MITISVVLDDLGLLRSCKVQGHAGAEKRGHDIVCAAVSVLARTALATLSGRKGVKVRGRAPRRGDFSLETEAQTTAGQDFLAAIGAFLIEGFGSVAEEYPQNCSLTITKQERRN